MILLHDNRAEPAAVSAGAAFIWTRIVWCKAKHSGCFRLPSMTRFTATWGLWGVCRRTPLLAGLTLHPVTISWPQWLGVHRSQRSPMVFGGQIHCPVLVSQLLPTWLHSQAKEGNRTKNSARVYAWKLGMLHTHTRRRLILNMQTHTGIKLALFLK